MDAPANAMVSGGSFVQCDRTGQKIGVSNSLYGNNRLGKFSDLCVFSEFFFLV